jgi:ABC-2 type transport system permease protein
MRLFFEIVHLAARRQLTYRGAMWAGLLTNVFFGLLRANVMIALYADRSEVAGMTLQDAITFTALSQAVIAYLSFWGWYDVMNSVNSGEIAGDLLRPFSYFRFWLAVDLGRSVINLLLRGLPILLVYALFVELTRPTTLPQWGALGIALSLGWLVSFGWRFLVNLAAFWSPNAAGIGRFAFGIVAVLSGFFMPLRYFPEWFQTFSRLTPFPAMINTPIEVYLGLLTGPDLVAALGMQLGWAIGLTLLGQATLRRGVRKLVIQGG